MKIEIEKKLIEDALSVLRSVNRETGHGKILDLEKGLSDALRHPEPSTTNFPFEQGQEVVVNTYSGDVHSGPFYSAAHNFFFIGRTSRSVVGIPIDDIGTVEGKGEDRVVRETPVPAVVLKDGTVYFGTIYSVDAQFVRVKLPNGTVLSFPAEDVSSIKPHTLPGQNIVS